MLSALKRFFDGITGYLMDMLAYVVNLLPNSPFEMLDNSPIAPYLSTLNYFVPIREIILILETWLVAIGLYYLYMIALRWIKAISD